MYAQACEELCVNLSVGYSYLVVIETTATLLKQRG